ncbi:MAG: DUF4062 domain-containing protein [Hydrogenophilales bacterium 16-64-46]|nr:MAG: DUF4062 domain-containing protein [Hydrogenophilales bacterium 16-64-46]OZA40267.1 MAG: DUF4062 domain-containing protein [Hydrogenophilales bacterium 17-64-34]HQT00819.1 DUF4062 domain-containing protein [Thiobacillus sp.]
MSYVAKTFNVMIASPGDVASERSIVRDVVYEWNAVHSNARKIVLLLIGWESHSSPEMGASPQAVINNQVLEKCDLLVGVFWTRLGTETDEYASGTVEEIERHVEAGKPAMLYFSSQPVALNTVDLKQVENLKSFKDSCRGKGLYESYDSHADFRTKFYRHLQLKVNEHPLFCGGPAEEGESVAESKTNLPSLTSEARVLLKEASLDPHGTVLYVRYIGGTDIQTNGKNVIPSKDRRDVAKWEQALQELVDLNLVVARGHKCELFEVSNLGYQVADMIAL